MLKRNSLFSERGIGFTELAGSVKVFTEREPPSVCLDDRAQLSMPPTHLARALSVCVQRWVGELLLEFVVLGY